MCAYQVRCDPNINAGLLSNRCQRRVCRWPLIGERDAGAGSREVDGCRPRGVIVRCYQDLLPEDESVAIQVGTDRACEHHAREVIIPEKQWTLDGAFGVDDCASTQRDDDLSRFALCRIGASVIAALDQHGCLSVIDADYGRSPKYLHIRQ